LTKREKDDRIQVTLLNTMSNFLKSIYVQSAKDAGLEADTAKEFADLAIKQIRSAEEEGRFKQSNTEILHNTRTATTDTLGEVSEAVMENPISALQSIDEKNGFPIRYCKSINDVEQLGTIVSTPENSLSDDQIGNDTKYIYVAVLDNSMFKQAVILRGETGQDNIQAFKQSAFSGAYTNCYVRKIEVGEALKLNYT